MSLPLLDIAILAVYMAGVTAWGAWLGRGQAGGRDYFLGNRDLPWAAVMLSIVATETSTLTFLSIPGVAYFGTLAFLQIALGYLVGRTVVAWVLLPAYYRGEMTTAYQLLETRFGRPTRRLTSAIFMITRLLADSVRLFATAIPLALLMEWSLPLSILTIGLLTALYTYAGGIRAVVWVDALQMGVYMLGALVAVVALGLLVPGGWGGILGAAGAAGKLVVIDPAFDFGVPYTLWAGLIGGAFLSMGSHGADQLIVQRVLTCRTLRGGQKALVTSGALVILQFAVFLAIGVGLWVYYGGQSFARPDAIFADFIVQVLPPGLRGFLIAGVFAAAMSTLSSSINSLASATTYDFWAPAVGAGDDSRLLGVGRAFSALWTALLIGGAILFIPMGEGAPAVEVALGIASLVYGGLLGGFALALFVPGAGQWHAIAGIVTGIAAVTAIWLFARDAVAWPWFVAIGTAVTFLVGTSLSAMARGGHGGRPAEALDTH